MIQLYSTLTCPNCGTQEELKMPEDRCMILYQCKKCNLIFRPLTGDCCVFCSYGDTKCPSMQKDFTVK